MAESLTQKIGNKSGHIFNQAMMGIRKGAQVGAVLGAVIGVGSLFAAVNIATLGAGGLLMGVASYGLFGAVGGAICGLNAGAWIGGVKGFLSRPKPNGEQIMENAQACEDPHPEAPVVQEPAQQPQIGAQPEIKLSEQSQQGETTLPKQAIEDLNAMTKTLNEIQANVAVNAQQQATAVAQQPAPQTPQPSPTNVPSNWQSRVQADKQMAAALQQR